MRITIKPKKLWVRYGRDAKYCMDRRDDEKGLCAINMVNMAVLALADAPPGAHVEIKQPENYEYVVDPNEDDVVCVELENGKKKCAVMKYRFDDWSPCKIRDWI